jgi:hypothetical protein
MAKQKRPSRRAVQVLLTEDEFRAVSETARRNNRSLGGQVREIVDIWLGLKSRADSLSIDGSSPRA